MIVNDSEIEREFILVQNERELLNEVAKELWFCTNRLNELSSMSVAEVPLADDEQEAIQPLLNNGYEFIGTGIGRIVLRMPSYGGLDEYVVKLARYGQSSSAIGMFQNRTEIYLSGTLPDALPINPVIDWNPFEHRWLVMPYGTPLTDIVEQDSEAEEMIKFAKCELEKYEMIDVDELVPENFIVRDGNIYLTDYGTRGDMMF